MIIQCPECNTRYSLPDGSITDEGRDVRCTQCSHTWLATSQAADEKPQVAAKPAMEPIEKKVVYQKKLPPASIFSKITAAFSIIGGIFTEPVTLRHKIGITIALISVTVFILLIYSPATAGYQNTKGLALSHISMINISHGKHKSYEISGKIYNTTQHPITMPTMRVSLINSNSDPLQYWEFHSDQNSIKPHSAIPFSTGNMDIHFTTGDRFTIDIGNQLELALRQSPPPIKEKIKPKTDDTKK